MKKIFVVSDVHGHYTILKKSLDSAGYNSNNENHFLVCCGDYFDRGDENVEVMKFFERIKNKALIRGNHEDLLLELFKTGKLKPHNYSNGTINTIQNFFGKFCIDPVDDSIDFSGKTRILDRICEFIEETVDYFETERYVFVHGWIADKAVTTQKRESTNKSEWKKARWKLWADNYNGERPLENKTLVCGHQPTFVAKKFDDSRDGECVDIFYGNGLIAIDAATADTKQINVLVIEDNI